MKKVLIGLAALIVILVLASFVLLGKLDGLIADAINKHGSEALGVPVSVSEVKTDLKEGKLSILGLSIANPAGYSKPYAFKVNEFSAGVDYENKEIAEILINNPVINAELKGAKSNFEDILNGLPESETEEATEVGEEPELKIQSLKLLAAKINLVTDTIGNHGFVMDDFVLRNIKGTPTQIANEVSTKLTKHVTNQVSKFAKKEIANLAKSKVKAGLQNKVKGSFGGKLKSFSF